MSTREVDQGEKSRCGEIVREKRRSQDKRDRIMRESEKKRKKPPSPMVASMMAAVERVLGV